MCSFNRGNIEGTNSSKICVWCLCMYVLCLWSDLFCRLTWQRVDTYVRRVQKCVFAYDLSLTVLRRPCVVDRTLKSNYYYTKKQTKKRLTVLHKTQSIANISNISIYVHLHATEKFTSKRVIWDVFCINFKTQFIKSQAYIWLINWWH